MIKMISKENLINVCYNINALIIQLIQDIHVSVL